MPFTKHFVVEDLKSKFPAAKVVSFYSADRVISIAHVVALIWNSKIMVPPSIVK